MKNKLVGITTSQRSFQRIKFVFGRIDMKAANLPMSTCEKDFILQAIQTRKRLDGRQTYDYRKITISFGVEHGHCEVQLGSTRVLAQVSCEIIEPKANRPTEGQLFFNVEFSPMASPEFETGRMTEYGIQLNRYIERCYRESCAVDIESLCIVAGEKVWNIRVDIHVLDHGGNIADCASIAAITSLAHFRHPAVSVIGEEVTIHSHEDREPVLLSVHHMPVCISFAFFDNGEYLLVDPTDKEESVMDAKMLVAMNIHRELCAVQMIGGVSLQIDQIIRCSKIAVVKMSEITELIQKAISEDKINRKAGRIGVTQVCSQPTRITKNLLESTEVDFTDTVQEVADKIDETNTSPPDNSDLEVFFKGPGTAQIGEGGSMQWTISDDDDDEEEEETITIPDDEDEEMKEQEISDKKSINDKQHKIQQVVISDSLDSEEEEVVMLTNDDLGGFQKSSDKQPSIDVPIAVESEEKKEKDNTQKRKKKKKKLKQGQKTPVVDLT